MENGVKVKATEHSIQKQKVKSKKKICPKVALVFPQVNNILTDSKVVVCRQPKNTYSIYSLNVEQ